MLIIISLVILILLYIKNFHIQKVSENVCILEEYFSFKTMGKRIRITSPGGIHFTFNHPDKLKFMENLSDVATTCARGHLKDMSSYMFMVKYKLDFPNTESKKRNFFEMLNYTTAERNFHHLQRTFETIITNSLAINTMCKTSSELATMYDIKKHLSSILPDIINEANMFYEFEIIDVKLEIGPGYFSPKPIKKFENAELTFAGLQEAGYDEQQINQILKASEKNIYLNNINPLVPENIFRKIRKIYDENNEFLKDCIYHLTIKDKTQEEIDKVCDNILKL